MKKMLSADPKIIIALDGVNLKQLSALTEQLDPKSCRLKVGKETFTRAGPAFVERLVAKNFSVFLDLKFHDIPNTVAGACKAAAELGVWMLNVHACGGSAMMEAAAESLATYQASKPLLIAVTVLTSMEQSTLQQIGIQRSLREQVEHLAQLTQAAGLDGVVCSAQEASTLRNLCGSDFCLVTPGIRPATAAFDDQSRVMTPAAALMAGSNYLVIGRPITAAKDPMQALLAINHELDNLTKSHS